MLFNADFVGAGYDTGDEPVSGRVNIAAEPEISKDAEYSFSTIKSLPPLLLHGYRSKNCFDIFIIYGCSFYVNIIQLINTTNQMNIIAT
jgi:hypothetical protein